MKLPKQAQPVARNPKIATRATGFSDGTGVYPSIDPGTIALAYLLWEIYKHESEK